MSPEELLAQIATFSPRDMMSNLDLVSGMARRIRLKQGVGSSEDELTLCRMMLDLKFMTEMVDALRIENSRLIDAKTKLETKLENLFLEKGEEWH